MVIFRVLPEGYGIVTVDPAVWICGVCWYNFIRQRPRPFADRDLKGHVVESDRMMKEFYLLNKWNKNE